MVQVSVMLRNGETRVIDAVEGQSLMSSIRDAGIDELLALCGGSCSCATCHIHVGDDWTDKLGPPVGDEDDLLESSDDRDATSRLSCQIIVVPTMDGLTVRIAAED